MGNLTPTVLHVNIKDIEIGRLSYDYNGNEFILGINTQNREKLLKANFPYDFYFHEEETCHRSKEVPIILRQLIPQRQSLAEAIGIESTDHDWVKLGKVAKYFSCFRRVNVWLSPVAIEDIKPIHIIRHK